MANKLSDSPEEFDIDPETNEPLSVKPVTVPVQKLSREAFEDLMKFREAARIQPGLGILKKDEKPR